EANRVPFVDLYTPTLALINDKKGGPLTFNGIHLTQYGNWAVAHLMAEQLGMVLSPWTFERNMNFAKGFGVAVKPGEKLPRPPPPPAGAKVHAALKARLPQMTFKNLPLGEYELLLNGQRSTIASSNELQQGVRLLAGPGQDAAEKLRAAIVDRNQEFFYRWRA